MSKIEGIRIRNYRALRDVKFGRLYQDWRKDGQSPLTPLTVVIGRNGVGKSSFFDVFGFLSDCLQFGVEEACDRNGRGGFDRIHTKETDGPISFEIYYRENAGEQPITYEISIDKDSQNRPFVSSERLRQRRKNQTNGRPYSFLILNGGKGVVWRNEGIGIQETGSEDEILSSNRSIEASDREEVELDDTRRLGIATLGSLKQHPRISKFRKFIENWYLSYFTPDAARGIPVSAPQKRLSIHGDNLGNVVQYMRREYAAEFDSLLRELAGQLPELTKIDTEETPDKRILLRFFAKGFDTPFYAQQMSDGTLKAFSYLLLLSSPEPPPLLCIEEPENGIHHRLMSSLVSEFRSCSERKGNASQIFVTTHQPYLLNELKPDEVWILEKGLDGFSTASRASSDSLVEKLVDAEVPLGDLWHGEYLNG